jgi:hypothetical protein
MKKKNLVTRLMELHRHLGHEPGKMTTLYGEATLLEVSLLLLESAKEIRALRKRLKVKQ